MRFVTGIAVLISPWLSLFIATIMRTLNIEYKKYKMRRFPQYSALIISSFAYCTFNEKFGDFGILTRFLSNIRKRSLIEYALPEIVSAIGPFNWLFFFIAKTADYALMCMLPAAIIYYIYGKVTVDVCIEKKQKCSDFIRVYIVGILFLQFFTILEHGRFIMAGCILIYAIYHELYLGKKDGIGIVLYLLPLCFHLGILPLYAFRIIVKCFSKRKILWFLAIALAYLTIMYSGDFFSFLPYSVVNYIFKARAFFNGESEWGKYVFESRFYIILRMIFNIAFLAIINLTIKLTKNKKLNNDCKGAKGKRLFLYFVMEMGFFGLLTNFIVSEAFWRYGTLLFFFIPFILIYARVYLSFSLYKIYKYIFILVGLGITLMQIAMVLHNDIFPFADFFATAKTFNMVAVLYHDIKAFLGLL